MANDHKNVLQQFNDRAKTQLAGTAAMAFDGRPIDTEGLEKWYRVSFLGMAPQPVMGSSARVEDWLWQVDCFALVDHKRTGVYKATELADTAVTAFARTNVDVLDWTEATPTTVLAKLEFLWPEVDHLPPSAAEPRLMRSVVTVHARVLDA